MSFWQYFILFFRWRRPIDIVYWAVGLEDRMHVFVFHKTLKLKILKKLMQWNFDVIILCNIGLNVFLFPATLISKTDVGIRLNLKCFMERISPNWHWQIIYQLGSFFPGLTLYESLDILAFLSQRCDSCG